VIKSENNPRRTGGRAFGQANRVAAIGNRGRIQFHTENATVFGHRAENNIRLAILSIPPGSILIAWQESFGSWICAIAPMEASVK